MGGEGRVRSTGARESSHNDSMVDSKWILDDYKWRGDAKFAMNPNNLYLTGRSDPKNIRLERLIILYRRQ